MRSTPVKDPMPIFASIQRMARGLGRAVSRQLYPPICAHCAAPIADAHGLCAQCWRGLQPITAPMCPVLGLPFSVAIGANALSAEAIADPPVFDRARSAVVYNDIARSLVSQFKYGDHPEFGILLGRMLAGAAAELFEGDAVLVPVPLHWRRQLARRYNQSTELARALAKITGLEIANDLARRKRATKQQVGLTQTQRRRNVSGAFVIDPGRAIKYAGRRLILVDDVITTGSTVRALSKACKRAGFDHIDVVSFARVVFGGDTLI